MWTEAWPGASRGACRSLGAAPHVRAVQRSLLPSPERPTPTYQHPVPSTRSAIPVTFLCTHIPVCMAPKPACLCAPSRPVGSPRLPPAASWPSWDTCSPMPPPPKAQAASFFWETLVPARPRGEGRRCTCDSRLQTCAFSTTPASQPPLTSHLAGHRLSPAFATHCDSGLSRHTASAPNCSDVPTREGSCGTPRFHQGFSPSPHPRWPPRMAQPELAPGSLLTSVPSQAPAVSGAPCIRSPVNPRKVASGS